jgi:hypothetical protein
MEIAIKYNTPIQVNKSQYNASKRYLSGIVACRTENGNYWIKCLYMRLKSDVIDVLNNYA